MVYPFLTINNSYSMEDDMTQRTSPLSLIYGLFFLTLTACTMSQQPIGNPEAPYPPTAKPAVGDIVHLPTGVKVTEKQMYAAITDARIVYVGETHDNPAAHRLELQILRAMEERYPGQLSLGMEMFNTSQQETLDQWVAGELSAKVFLKSSNWFSNWQMDYAYYSEILDFARERKIPVIGLNATREMVKTVGRTSLGDLDEATRNKLPEFDLTDPYQQAMLEAIYADHSQGDKMLGGFARIQTLWDETMAENIVKTMTDKSPEHRMVVMAGGNHIRYGFGIPRRVYRRLPTSYMLIGSREIVIPKEKQDKLMNVDMPRFPMTPYDYLVYTEYESLPGERVKLGVRMKEEDGKVVVEAVVPNSTADEAGVLEGDVIVSLNEALIEDSFDLIYEVKQRVSGDQSTLVVERAGKQLSLDVTFIPLPETVDHGMGDRHKK